MHDQYSKTVQLVEQAIVRAQRTPVYATQATCEAAIARTKAHIVAVNSAANNTGNRDKSVAGLIRMMRTPSQRTGRESNSVERTVYLDAERANLVKLENVLGRIKCRL